MRALKVDYKYEDRCLEHLIKCEMTDANVEHRLLHNVWLSTCLVLSDIDHNIDLLSHSPTFVRYWPIVRGFGELLRRALDTIDMTVEPIRNHIPDVRQFVPTIECHVQQLSESVEFTRRLYANEELDFLEVIDTAIIGFPKDANIITSMIEFGQTNS